MRIVEVRDRLVPISRYADPSVSGSSLTTSIVAVMTDVKREAKPVVGFGFSSFGRFGHRHFGESGGAPRQLVQVQGQQKDFHAAIRCARDHVGVDPEPVALWGTSLGGGHVIVVAAADPRIAAVVAQVPFNGFPRRVEGRSAMATLRLLGAMVTDTVHGWSGLAPAYIRVVGQPGDLAVIASPKAQQAIDGIQGGHWRNEVAPRALFEMMRYKPSAWAGRLGMPVLVCIADHDRESPVELPRQIANNARAANLRAIPAPTSTSTAPTCARRSSGTKSPSCGST
jgi:pimeloyl-ACP methyl ester carboxylesterase